jgi:nickel/cobalt exporter
MVGLVADLIPCPLTLLVMLYALARGVAVAGVAFAVAILGRHRRHSRGRGRRSVLARDSALRVMARYRGSIERIGCALEAVSGALLILIGIGALLRLTSN